MSNYWLNKQCDDENIIKYDELNAAIDGKLSNYLIAPPVGTQLFGDKLSNRSIRGIYARCGVHLATDAINPLAPQFVNCGISAFIALNKGDGI